MSSWAAPEDAGADPGRPGGGAKGLWWAGPALTVTAAEWITFTAGVRDGDFD